MHQGLFAVYGASGFGREVMPIARMQLRRQNIADDRLVFVDDVAKATVLNGQRVLTYAQFLAEPADSRHVALAIANSEIREQLTHRCVADGIIPWSVTADNVQILDDVTVARGAILCAFTTLTSTVRIGTAFHGNIYSYVAHDCVIGDYVTFAPAVKCNGNVVIEDHAYIGTGAIIKQGKPGQPLVIGRKAVVGMGAVVTKDVPAGETVIGNPAKPLVKR
jgi:sugar O-acyltransferase (sialic acid O-acetyltransferase NeuD family)